MANKVFQNMDLIREIYSYGEPEHRHWMWFVLQQTKEVLLSKVPATYPYSRGDAHLKKELTQFFLLNRCRCCSRHSHNKPTILFGHQDDHDWLVLDNITVFVPECKDLGNCLCDCRHKMRKLSEFIGLWSHMNILKLDTIQDDLG